MLGGKQWEIQGSKGPKVPGCQSCVRQHVARTTQVQLSGLSPVAAKSMRQTTSWPLSAKSHLQYFTSLEETTTNMKKTLRPIPYPPGSEARRRAVAWSVKYTGTTYREAVRQIMAINLRCKNTPAHGERRRYMGFERIEIFRDGAMDKQRYRKSADRLGLLKARASLPCLLWASFKEKTAKLSMIFL